jgi:hypothetical protein
MTTLGGGIQGIAPPIVGVSNNSALNRFSLRTAWNGALGGNTYKSKGIAVSPFRAVNNAGDVLSRQNYSCGGSNQVNNIKPSLHPSIGGILSACDGSGIEPSTCNVKYVYDSSDFSKYKKLKAINQNYNDSSFGGNDSSAQQMALRRVRQ